MGKSEEFRLLPGTNGEIEVSSFGYLRNAITKKIYKLYQNKSTKYVFATPYTISFGKKTYCIHKAVATTYLNISFYPYEIHHKDRNPLNNSVDNLLVCHPSEHRNIHKQIDLELLNSNCLAFSPNEEIVYAFYSIYQASKETNIPAKAILKAIKSSSLLQNLYWETLPKVKITKILSQKIYNEY